MRWAITWRRSAWPSQAARNSGRNLPTERLSANTVRGTAIRFRGYKVVFVPFSGGKPSGHAVDVLTGFLSVDGRAQGRPVGVAIDKSGALLVADDVGNTVWRVTAAK